MLSYLMFHRASEDVLSQVGRSFGSFLPIWALPCLGCCCWAVPLASCDGSSNSRAGFVFLCPGWGQRAPSMPQPVITGQSEQHKYLKKESKSMNEFTSLASQFLLVLTCHFLCSVMLRGSFCCWIYFVLPGGICAPGICLAVLAGSW